jgi:hypothetical protein
MRCARAWRSSRQSVSASGAVVEAHLPVRCLRPRSNDATDDRPIGQGTAFRIDPWSRCATAFHVVEELFELDGAGLALTLKPTLRLAALELNGLAYGLPPVPDGA